MTQVDPPPFPTAHTPSTEKRRIRGPMTSRCADGSAPGRELPYGMSSAA